MTRFKYVSAAIVICTILQTTLIGYLSVFGIKPLLLVAVAICSVLSFGLIPGAAAGLVCGLIADITGGRGVGLSALLLLYICILCGLLCPKIFKEKIGVVILFTFAANFVFEFLYSFFMLFAWGKGGLGFIIIHNVLPESVLTSIFAIPVFIIFKKVKNTEWTNI